MESFERLGLALAIGFLVGVERGWRARDIAEGGRTAGIRTYALSGLLGGVAGELARTVGGWAFAALAIPFAVAFVLFKLRELKDDGEYSVTDVVAALLVFALGGEAVLGDWRLAASGAVAATALLASKPILHAWLKTITWPELRSALILLAMSFLFLPMLPDRDMGPWGAVNPYQLWLLTVVIGGVSFVAYVAARVLGEARGAILASVVGALVSSTAVTLDLARRNRIDPKAEMAHAGAALIASAIMAARVALIAAALAPALVLKLAPPLGAFTVVSLALGALAARRGLGVTGDGPSAVRSPLDLVQVLRFAAILGVVMAAAKVLSALYGGSGLVGVSAIAGLADVDAVTLTAGKMAAAGLDVRTAVLAVLAAMAADTLSKTVIAWSVGGARFGALYAGGSLVGVAAAAGAIAWAN